MMKNQHNFDMHYITLHKDWNGKRNWNLQ